MGGGSHETGWNRRLLEMRKKRPRTQGMPHVHTADGTAVPRVPKRLPPPKSLHQQQAHTERRPSEGLKGARLPNQPGWPPRHKTGPVHMDKRPKHIQRGSSPRHGRKQDNPCQSRQRKRVQNHGPVQTKETRIPTVGQSPTGTRPSGGVHAGTPRGPLEDRKRGKGQDQMMGRTNCTVAP